MALTLTTISTQQNSSSGVNFTNILEAANLYKFFMCFVIYWQKNIDTKAIHKMLVKLTTCVDFTEILKASFSFAQLLCAYTRKVAQKMLIKCW